MGLYTIVVIALVVSAILLAGFSKNKGTEFASIALFISLVGALICGQVLNDYLPFIAVLAFSLILTSRWSSGLAHIVSLLYGVRILLVGLEHYAVFSLSEYQEVNSWLVIVQAVIVIIGSVRDGGIKRFNGTGRGFYSGVRLVAPDQKQVCIQGKERAEEAVQKTSR